MTIHAAGVDSGSTQTKGVIIDERRRIVGRSLIDTGANTVRSAERASPPHWPTPAFSART
jgi:activator of 2-hydroxyglutaryl-CoA dehydratase